MTCPPGVELVPLSTYQRIACRALTVEVLCGIADVEKRVEDRKKLLADQCDYDVPALFRKLNPENFDYLSTFEYHAFMSRFIANDTTIKLLFKRHARTHRGKVYFSDFERAISPHHPKSDTNRESNVTVPIDTLLAKLFLEQIEAEKQIRSLCSILKSSTQYEHHIAFGEIIPPIKNGIYVVNAWLRIKHLSNAFGEIFIHFSGRAHGKKTHAFSMDGVASRQYDSYFELSLQRQRFSTPLSLLIFPGQNYSSFYVNYVEFESVL
eukprot:189029_1